MKIVGTGLSGLVGSRIVELLSGDFSFTNLSLETGVDITDSAVLEKYIGGSDAPWVFHFAAFTDVDGCEKQRIEGENSVSWKVNFQATRDIAALCKKMGKHMIVISTDYVFDGTKDMYTENDQPSPVGWYGITKYEGEKKVMELGSLGLVIRIANPYRAKGPGKPDFVHKILERFDNGLSVASPVDSAFSPTFIDDIAMAIKKLVTADASGVFHVVGDTPVSPYEATQKIAQVFGKDINQIVRTTFLDFFKNRAPRPLHASLINGKISHYGIKMSTFTEGLIKIKKQEEIHI